MGGPQSAAPFLAEAGLQEEEAVSVTCAVYVLVHDDVFSGMVRLELSCVITARLRARESWIRNRESIFSE